MLAGARTRAEVAGSCAGGRCAGRPERPHRQGEREGIPVVLMEAMSTGLPVVASGISGIPELVEHERSGLLVARGTRRRSLARSAPGHDPSCAAARPGAGGAVQEGSTSSAAPSSSSARAPRSAAGCELMTRAFWPSLAASSSTPTCGFPLLVLAARACARGPYAHRRRPPEVSVVIAARNEAAAIGPSWRASSRADYPRDRLEVIVASDGSDDGTEDVRAHEAGACASWPCPGWARPRRSTRRSPATGEVLVFTDANSTLAPDAIRALVGPSPTRGGRVAGDQRYRRRRRRGGGGGRRAALLGLRPRAQGGGEPGPGTPSRPRARSTPSGALFGGGAEGVTDDFATSTASSPRAAPHLAPDAVA